MTDLDAIVLVVCFATGLPAWAAAIYWMVVFVRQAIELRKARRAICEPDELLGRIDSLGRIHQRGDLILDVHLQQPVKV